MKNEPHTHSTRYRTHDGKVHDHTTAPVSPEPVAPATSDVATTEDGPVTE